MKLIKLKLIKLKPMKLKTSTYSLLATFALSVCSLQAAVISPLLSTDAGSVTSSFLTSEDASRTFDSALDGSGLSTTLLTDANVMTVTHTSSTLPDNHYLGNTALTGGGATIASEVLTFDLGGTFDVTDIYLWDYQRSQTARSLISFDIAFSTDGGATFGTAVAASTLGITDFVIWDGSSTTAQNKTFSSTQSGVNAIQFSNVVNNGDSTRLGIAEIRFGGTAVIPEPSSAILSGLGALLLLRRRRD